MRFCPNCENLLIPKNKEFYCRACDQYFNLEPSARIEYILVKTIKHDDIKGFPIVKKEPLDENRISYEDRKAFKDYFNPIADV